MDNFLLLPRSLAASLFDTAFAITFGLVVAGIWLQASVDGRLGRRLRRGTIACTLAMLVALPIQAYLLAATMTGTSNFTEIHAQFRDVITGTHAGRVILCNTAVAVIFLIVLSALRSLQSKTATLSQLFVLAILAATRAASGHASADGDFNLPEFVQFIHLVSTAVWSGGVIVTGFLVLPEMLRTQKIDHIVQFTRRLSQTVTVALLLIILTGVYNSYRGLGSSLEPLIRTQWGGLLDVKIVLVTLAISMGAYSRLKLKANPTLSPLQASRLSLMLRAEAAVMLLILSVSAWLANSPAANPI